MNKIKLNKITKFYPISLEEVSAASWMPIGTKENFNRTSTKERL